jgi:hypothetical protein
MRGVRGAVKGVVVVVVVYKLQSPTCVRLQPIRVMPNKPTAGSPGGKQCVLQPPTCARLQQTNTMPNLSA